MLATSLMVCGKEYLLRYENKQQSDIKHNGPRKILPDMKGLRFTGPTDILNYLADTDVQIYLLQKGLEWVGSGFEKIDFDKAADLRQAYLEDGEADDGAKYEAFQELLAEALTLNVVGASGKKLRAKGEALQKKAEEEKKKVTVEELALIYEAKILAEKRASEKIALADGNGKIGTEKPPESQ